jgi:hypothetical protein
MLLRTVVVVFAPLSVSISHPVIKRLALSMKAIISITEPAPQPSASA